SARARSMALVKAGLKSAALIFSKCGMPPCGPVHGSSNAPIGFAPFVAAAAICVAPVDSAAVAAAPWRDVRLFIVIPNVPDCMRHGTCLGAQCYQSRLRTANPKPSRPRELYPLRITRGALDWDAICGFYRRCYRHCWCEVL